MLDPSQEPRAESGDHVDAGNINMRKGEVGLSGTRCWKSGKATRGSDTGNRCQAVGLLPVSEGVWLPW